MSKLGPKKSSTKKPFNSDTGNIFGSGRLDVPQCYLDEAAEKGLEVRWVSAKEMKENHGAHKWHWVVYKFESKPSSGIIDASRFAFGIDPEGVVRRGDCVLAVRPIELGDQHRAHLAERRKRYNRFGAAKKKEFRDFVKNESRGAMKVDDSTDDE